MIVEVVGVKKTSFETKDTKETIRGFNLYTQYEQDGVTGLATERFFISENKAAGWEPAPGDTVEISFNRFGKIDTVTVS